MDLSDYARGYPHKAWPRLIPLVQEVYPVDLSIGRWDNKESWRIDPKPEATQDHIEAVQAILAAFDPWGDDESDTGQGVSDNFDPVHSDSMDGGSALGGDDGSGEAPTPLILEAPSAPQIDVSDPAPSGVFDSGPALEEIREAYEDSHADNEGAGDVGLAEHSSAVDSGDGGELVEAPEDDPAGDPADYSAEPVGDDLEPADEHQTEDVSPANLGGVLIQGDALATAKAMALMAVDDERFARVGDYDKAANQTKLDELRAIQQAIREGVHPPFTDEQAAELQALETFLPFTQRIDDHAQGLRNAIRDAADLEQLTAIDLLNGWPD